MNVTIVDVCMYTTHILPAVFRMINNKQCKIFLKKTVSEFGGKA